MAFQTDDLEVNPFFRCLQTTFHAKYEEAQKMCWLVCIPHTAAVKGLKITGHIIDYHIFKPSRYFKSQYVSTDKNESRTIEIEDEKIKVVAGACDGLTVDILSEELSYNKDFKPFKVYVISKPLDSFSSSRASRMNSLEKRNTHPKISNRECCSFLRSYSCHLEALNELDKKLNLFNQNYVVLSNYLHDAARRIQDLVLSSTKILLSTHAPPLDEQEPLALEIKSCVESYVLGKVHQKIFSVIRQTYSTEDQLLTECLQELYTLNLTPDQLGVKESFCCPLSSAVVELASLNSKVTPSEKLHCLKMSLEHIPEDICNTFKLAENPFKKNDDIPNLTSDDLIPLLVYVIVQSRVQYLESNLYYIQNFTWNLSSWDKHSFVTFQAAKEFLKTHNFSHLRPSNNQLKKEMSLEELIEVTVEIQKHNRNQNSKPSGTSVNVSKGKEPSNTSPTPQLERITRMIEDSTRELRQLENVQIQAARFRRSLDGNTHRPEDSLGDFLSSFQKDGFGINCGKQS